MKNVNYKGLRKFEIGKINTNPGYQVNKNIVNTGSFNSQLGYDMSGDVEAALNSFLPTVMTGVGNVGNVAMNFALNYTSEAAAKAAQAAGNTAAKAGMSTLGKVAGVAGAVYGTGSMIKDFVDFRDRLSASDMLNMASTSTQSRHGVNYQTYDGFNAQLIMDYTNAQNKSGVWSSTLNGLSAGSSLGSIWGPWGLAIGGVAGALTGLFGGLLGSDSRKRKVIDTMNHTADMFQAHNTQSEYAAGSKGYRIEFNLTHGGNNSAGADGGKRPGESLSGGKYGVIQTPSGPAYGEIQGLASPDEGLIDMVTGETNYNGSKDMNVRDRRADVIPVGITGYANGGAFDSNVGIPGHKMDINGLSFADNARPLFKANEQLKDAAAAIDMELQENKAHKTRNEATKRYMENRLNLKKKQIQQQYQLNAQGIADIVNRQTAMTSGAYFNCGKTPKFDPGKDAESEDSTYGFEPIKLNFLVPRYVTFDQFQRAAKTGELFEGIKIKAPTMDELTSHFKFKPSILGSGLWKDWLPKDDDNNTTMSSNNKTGANLFGASYAGLSPIYGALQSLPYAIADLLAADKDTPYAQNSFVSNPTAQSALNVLGSLRYDPYRQIRQLTTAGRQNLYNINNAGSLSAGQRAALASSGNIQLAQAAMNIYDKQQEMNNALAKDYATALMSYGQDEASRLQQANAYQQEAYRQAVGAKQKLQAQARKNWYTLGRQNLQDFDTWLNTQGMLDLWDRQVAADEAKAGIKKPTTTTSNAKPVKTTKKLKQKPVTSKSDMTASPVKTVDNTLRKNNRMSYAQVAKIASKKNISANSAWRHYMKYGNLNNL